MPPWVGLLIVATMTAACSGTGGFLAKDDEVFAPAGPGDPDDAVDGLTVGNRLMAAGEYELALRAFYRAGAETGLTADVLTSIGTANLALGRLGQAETLLRRAITVDAEHVPGWNNLGVVLMEQGKFGEAERVFRTAFALDSGNDSRIRENLSLALAKLENPAYDDANNATIALVREGDESHLMAVP